MMYFCPCPCNSPIDPETEESTFLALPRNLSYVQESYLDKHSVSARFVHNPKAELTQKFLVDQRTYRDEAEHHHEGLGSFEDVGTLHNNVQSPESSGSCHSSTGFDFSSYLQAQKQVASSAPIAVTTSPQNRPKLQSPDGAALASPGTGSFMSRVAASRLGSFLSSKEEQQHREPSSFSSDYDQDYGSSVDEPPSPLPDTTQIRSPDHRGLTMDRGEDLVFSPEGNDKHIVSAANVPLTSSSPPGIFHIEEDLRDPEEEDVLTLVLENDDSHKQQQQQQQQQQQSNDITNVADNLNSKTTGQIVQSLSSTSPSSSNGSTVYPGKECHYHKQSPTITISPENHQQTFKGNSTNSFESPDSDAFSEEGVFVNMMDDLDTNEKSTTVSEVSDDTCVSVDSMFLSPDEDELEEEKTAQDSHNPPRMSMEEAISRAASDLNKMSMMMYPDILKKSSYVPVKPPGDAPAGESRPKLGRNSPLRQTSGLKINLSHENLSTPKKEVELPESPVYDDVEFNFNKKGLRKSSSLKTNKTPPGTPHRKKVVRFADAMGLDLESVRHVLNMESPPRIPASAMADLKQGLGEERKDFGSRYLCPCFTQPGASEGFMQRVNRQKVCLENAIITDLTITGIVRVANIAYHKSVRVRYTHNNWATFHDIAASYVPNSFDGATDRFSFSIVAPAYFVAGNRLAFAVSFNAEGSEFWDSNGGSNYAFECFAKPVPTDNESAWLHFL